MEQLQLDNTRNWGLVTYTDGGCRPNPGAIGIGVHGYFYEIQDKAPVKPIKFTDGEIIKYAFPSEAGYIYCSKDGVASSAANKNAVPAAIVNYVEVAGSSSNQHTNNYAELMGLYTAVKLARTHQVKKLYVITDSDYALKAMTQWCKSWSENGWLTRQGTQVSNLELCQALYKEYTAAQDEGIQIAGNWIKGHKGHPGNMEADTLASIGVFKSRKGLDDTGINYFTTKQYQEPKRERHPLMSLKRMYFNREASRNTPGIYMMADPGKEDHLIGKPLPETVFAIVKMNEPIPLISEILKAQSRYGQDLDKIMMIKMENIYSPDVYRLIETHGENALNKDLRSTALVAMETRPVTFEKNPIGITMRAIDSINSLEAVFQRYEDIYGEKDNPDDNNIELKIHDLTQYFYESSEKKVAGEIVVKKTFNKDIAVGQKSFEIKFTMQDQEFSIPLKLAFDIPDRNALKKLEASDPVVHLITWKDSSVSFRYACVIRCTEGNAIWSNYYADRLFLKKDKPAK